MLTKFIQIIKQKLEKEDLNILCTDLQFLSLFESNNQKYKIGILNNSSSEKFIIKKYIKNALPIENIDKIKNINFDILLCDNPTELTKILNVINANYIYTSFKMANIPGYKIAGEFKRYGYWFAKEKIISQNIIKTPIFIEDNIEQPQNIIMPALNLPEIPSVYIIIPTYNQAQYTIKCLNSINKYYSKRFKTSVILVDNGSNEQNKRLVNNCVKKLNNISVEFIEYDMPIGFIKATNIGIKYALKNKANYICLQNNDTIVTKNWMDLLIDPIKDNIIGTGPTTNSPLAIQGFNKLRQNKVLQNLPENIEQKRSDLAANILQKQYQDLVIPITLNSRPFTPAFFCTMFRADIFEKFLLDECYGNGYGDDIDFCFRIMRWGLQLAYVPAAYVLHNHRTTFSTIYEKEEIQYQINAKLYQCKMVNYLNPKNKKKGVIYTCITNNYDILPQHSVYNLRDFDYICFTTKDNMKNIPYPWQVFNIEGLNYLIGTKDPVKIARWFKTHPHMFFRNYQYSIWIDGNIAIIKDPIEYINVDYKNMLVLAHPKRNCIYKQAKQCIALKKDSEEIINKEIAFIQEQNYPENNGLIQSGILLRNHNNKDIIFVMEKWWEMILNYSKRDQLSFNYIMWKYPTEYSILQWDDVDNKYFEWKKIHKSN